MVRKRTRQVGEVIGNAEPLLLDELTPVSSVELKREIEVEGVLLEDADLSSVQAASVRLAEVALRGVDLSGTELQGLRLVDVLATAVTAVNGSWRYVNMSRVAFDSSTLVGLDLAQSQLGATTFSECCKLDLVNLRMSTIENVVCLGCSLRETEFHGAKLRSVRFANCDLQEADFSHATLELVDLRSQAVADIRGVGSMMGEIVDWSQLIDLAPLLATELGIRIENPDHEA